MFTSLFLRQLFFLNVLHFTLGAHTHTLLTFNWVFGLYQLFFFYFGSTRYSSFFLLPPPLFFRSLYLPFLSISREGWPHFFGFKIGPFLSPPKGSWVNLLGVFGFNRPFFFLWPLWSVPVVALFGFFLLPRGVGNLPGVFLFNYTCWVFF